MRHNARAIVFDLDDTLYPLRHFRMSAFQAVAAHLHATHDIDAEQSVWFLTRMYESRARGHELQALLHQWQLPIEFLPVLIDVARHHQPELHLPAVSACVLAKLRPTWNLGILTNGPAGVQARKIQALGLSNLVDVVAYANTCGTGAGKPDRSAFSYVASALEVDPARTVFVGDDERCDIVGAMAAGMRAVRLTAWTGPCATSRAAAVIPSLVDLLTLAESLVREEAVPHVA